MRAAWRGALAALVSGVVLLVPASGALGAPVFPQPDGFVVDAAGVVPDAAERQIEASLEDYHQRTKGEVALAVVKSIDDTSIENYAHDLFNKWGVGSKQQDLGVLLVIAVDEHATRIETGYGAEAYITDVQAKKVLDGLVPLLRASDYAGALDQAQRQMRALLGDDLANSSAAPVPVPVQQQRRSSGSGSLVFILLPLLFFVFTSIGSGRRRRRRGYGWGFPIFYGGGWGGGGYGGGGFGGNGGFSGGGGGGGGGFGGFGGGSSGGGGASGSW